MEATVIAATDLPRTRDSIANDLRALGIEPGATILVHSSLSSIGWTAGGPITVIQALMDVVSDAGTIVMPTHSGDYSDPAEWSNPPVPHEWKQIIRDTLPAFDPKITPTLAMGAIAENFRSFPAVYRSNHPTGSFAAWGKHASEMTAFHCLNSEFGDESPLSHVYDQNGWVLLLGVDYQSNTSFHLAEYRSPQRKEVTAGAPIFEEGKRVWKTYTRIEYRTDEFELIGKDFEKICPIISGYVGSSFCRMFRQKDAVDFALNWLAEHPVKNE